MCINEISKGDVLLCNFTGLLRCKFGELYTVSNVNSKSFSLKGVEGWFFKSDLKWFINVD